VLALAGRCLVIVHGFLACESRHSRWPRSFAHAEKGRGGLVRSHGGVVIWDSSLLLYVYADLSHQVEPLIYEGFITFTTAGYGDYSPKTPAGRSVFVFWALLGLATMTILVSGMPIVSAEPLSVWL